MGSPSTPLIFASLLRDDRGYDVGGIVSSYFHRKLAPALGNIQQLACRARAAPARTVVILYFSTTR